jgi:DNA-binding Lrp family transcriptional regulator
VSGAWCEKAEAGAAPAVPPLAWSLGRAAAKFVADVEQISRGGAHLLQPLVLTAILEANQALINQDPALQLEYGSQGAPAPDELRRPVSVNAIAESLGLPFESVRRHVRRMAAQGLCVTTPRGIYVPRAAVTSPAYLAIQAARCARLKAFHGEAMRLGAVPADGARVPPAETPPEPIRAADRALAEYVLRSGTGLMAMTGGLVDGIVFLELACAGLEALGPQDLAPPAAVLATRLTPIRALPLAQRLGLPRETTRRHVQALSARGFCRRTRKGLVAALPPAAQTRAAALLEENLVNVRRLFARLDQLGVLAAWRAEGGAAA